MFSKIEKNITQDMHAVFRFSIYIISKFILISFNLMNMYFMHTCSNKSAMVFKTVNIKTKLTIISFFSLFLISLTKLNINFS